MKDLIFKKGLLNGVCRTYKYDKGQTLLAEGEFLNGFPNGTYTNWIDKKRKIVEHFEKGLPADGQKIFVSGELVGELVLDVNKMEYAEIVSYKPGAKIRTEPTQESLKRNFMYGKYLFLPANLR